MPVTILPGGGTWNRYQTVGFEAVVMSWQLPVETSQLAARSPCGTASHTVPAGCVRRWMSFSTCDLRGSIRLVMPSRDTRLCVFALKSAHPDGGPVDGSCFLAAVSMSKSGSGLAVVAEIRDTGVSEP